MSPLTLLNTELHVNPICLCFADRASRYNSCR